MTIFISAFCTLIIVLGFQYAGLTGGLIAIAFVTLVLILLYFAKKITIKNKGKKIEEAKEEHFVNVNKECWEVFEKLPFFSRVPAKRVVYLRTKYGKYKSLEDFFERNNIEENCKTVLEKFLVV